MDTLTGDLPQSKHFRLEELAGGVYAAIATEEGSAVGNAGIVDLGGETLVFDTFMTPAAARDLQATAERLTGNPVTYVINSHWHNDHIRGNQVFPSTTHIITTGATRTLIATKGREELATDKQGAEASLRAVRQRLETETDQAGLEDARILVPYFEGMIASLPDVQLRLANLTFEGRLVIHGSGRAAEALCFGGGHTDNDAILYLPEERIAFLGDLLFIGYQPYLCDGDPWEWTQALEKIENLDIKIAVPGHGRPGGPADLRLIRQYIFELEKLAAEVADGRGSADEAAAQEIPAPFSTWKLKGIFAQNMRFLHGRLARQGA
jgi:glyoxylase-like metal-dependent hydrolase (beta-lactamase superfamily II)